MTNTIHNNVWPVPKYYFTVNFGSGIESCSFQEVSGLDIETQEIEYRHGNSPFFSTINKPGITKHFKITLKKGFITKDNAFLDWYTNIKMNAVTRKTVVIKLLDNTGNTTMVWALYNAWPTKIIANETHLDPNEIAIETLELAHEGLTTDNF